jgi:hypothetical protein
MKTICFDFDGTLHFYVGWTGYEPPNPPVEGAREFVQWCVERGYKVCVCTCRADNELGKMAVESWLKKYGFPPMPVSNIKPPATFYIDDRAIRFEGDWQKVRDFFGGERGDE